MRDGRPVAPGLLWSRAAVLSGLAVLVGAVAHAGAGGLLPGPGTMLVLAVLTSLVTVRFLRSPASAFKISGLLVAGQTGVHAALTFLAGHADSGPQATTDAQHGFAFDGRRTERTGSLFDQWQAVRLAGQPEAGADGGMFLADGLQHVPEHLAGAGAAMAAAHLAVCVLLGLWLAVGERALWTLLALATRPLHAASTSGAALRFVHLQLAVLERSRSKRSVVEPDQPPTALIPVSGGVVRRGPPALLAA